MASEVDICNLALSHFGQAADLQSVTPSDGSAEGDHCARFYPIARNDLLASHDWTFARKRDTLATLTNDRDDWGYKYAAPSDMLEPRRLLPEGYADDLGDGQLYQREGDFIYSDVENATLVYTKLLTDTTKFSSGFTTTLSWHVSSYIAGPITKDSSGRIQLRLAQTAEKFAAIAKARDANSERNRTTYRSTAQRAHGAPVSTDARIDRGV